MSVDQNMTLKAKAFKSGLAPSNTNAVAYTIKAQAPQMSPGGGAYGTAQSVTLSTATAGASIRYTTDGSKPSSTAGTLYTGNPLPVTTTGKVRAIAVRASTVVIAAIGAAGTAAGATGDDPGLAPDGGPHGPGPGARRHRRRRDDRAGGLVRRLPAQGRERAQG